MSIELNKESVEQADASSCQGTNCGTTTGDHSSECLAEAAAGQGWELKPGDLCGRDCPIHKISVEQAGGDERAALQELIRVRDWVKNRRGQPEKLKNTGQTYIMIEKCETLDMLEWAIERARAALAQPSPDAPYADDIAADLERSDWTPEDALRWYAAGKHFDTVNGRTRIIDTGAVASNALKHLSLPYLEMKGDADLTELREAMAQPSPMRCLACRGDHGNSGLPCPNMRVTVQAQPSPKCVKCGGTGEADSGGVHPWGEPVLIPCDCETEQAEAERPEVVARVVHSNPVVLGQCGPLNANDELMTVAQHAASVARWAEMFNRVEQERDAALARVAELERQEPVALANRGLHAFWVKWTEAAAGLYGPGIKLYAAPVVQAQHSVPKEFIGRLSEFLAQRGATGKALLRELRALCAAAPGKEVGHE
ncbi:hypothetical protein KUC82_06965 [Pseudomonas aeruginosa]|uniref:hypothetical protein n=2 Tax=Pseudomonas aeruginosa TaxID=287 RepID=UPI0021E17247|nr:hypothetical protein [Pseudomonas aeruginosa]MCV0076778.1 hypothetical protein [Pseudomonas aeruginosa]MCV0200936.1 hypothetical protein [Pseudomonas aeruginosa]